SNIRSSIKISNRAKNRRKLISILEIFPALSLLLIPTFLKWVSAPFADGGFVVAVLFGLVLTLISIKYGFSWLKTMTTANSPSALCVATPTVKDCLEKVEFPIFYMGNYDNGKVVSDKNFRE
ncbi:MAG: hypothetical protein LBL00_03625, partial [Endomicrobium sp.]|nr:hypothetical protein [Endomicrobium sp.]